MGKRVLIIKAKDEKELQMRIKDSLKRGMKLLQTGVTPSPIHTVYWARVESEWKDKV